MHKEYYCQECRADTPHATVESADGVDEARCLSCLTDTHFDGDPDPILGPIQPAPVVIRPRPKKVSLTKERRNSLRQRIVDVSLTDTFANDDPDRISVHHLNEDAYNILTRAARPFR